MVLVLPVVVPWAFRNAKALQGITKDWGNQVQLDKCPRSILPQPSENKDRVNKLCISTWVQKGIDGSYFITRLGTWFMGTLLG